jgi:hypothetical protein
MGRRAVTERLTGAADRTDGWRSPSHPKAPPPGPLADPQHWGSGYPHNWGCRAAKSGSPSRPDPPRLASSTRLPPLCPDDNGPYPDELVADGHAAAPATNIAAASWWTYGKASSQVFSSVLGTSAGPATPRESVPQTCSVGIRQLRKDRGALASSSFPCPPRTCRPRLLVLCHCGRD